MSRYQSEGTQDRVGEQDSASLGITLSVTGSWKGPKSPKKGAREAVWGVGPSGA